MSHDCYAEVHRAVSRGPWHYKCAECGADVSVAYLLYLEAMERAEDRRRNRR